MSPPGAKRRKKARIYEVVIIPHGEAGRTKSFKLGSAQIAAWGTALAAVFFLVYSLAFRYTPAGVIVGADPSLRVAIDSMEAGTQRRLRALAEEIAVLKDYNQKLRKALGEQTAQGSEPEQAVPGTSSSESVRSGTGYSELQHDQQDFSSPAPAAAQFVASTDGLKAPFPLIIPAKGIVSRGYEPAQRHYGIDIAAKQGSPVYAAAPGFVMFAGWTYQDGNVLMLSHGPGYVTVYKHNSTLLKQQGAFVRRGEVIALVGNTGITSTGPHLHFEVLKDGLPVDPQEFLLTPARRRSG